MQIYFFKRLKMRFFVFITHKGADVFVGLVVGNDVENGFAAGVDIFDANGLRHY